MAQGMTVNRPKFYSAVRAQVFAGHMAQSQVDGMNVILDTWDKSELTDLRWLAYMFGTTYHETGATMQPVHENGGNAYLMRMYDVRGARPSTAIAMGNTMPGDGIRYCGRGFVQMTWKVNYAKAGQLLGVNLISNPDLAMQPDIAARIMFEGMTRTDIVFEDHTHSVGRDFNFTGKTLEDYFNTHTEDYIGARRIINGTDHAVLIAGTAHEFRKALSY